MTDQSISDLRNEADARRDAIARDVELVTDRVAPGRIADRQKARFGQRVSGLRDSVFGTSDRTRTRTIETNPADGDDSGSIGDKASNAVQQAKDAAPDSVQDFAEGNPMAAGLIGLGVGLLAATLIPTTPEEQKVADRAQDSIDAAAKQIAQSGQQAAEAVKPAAESAAADVKASAQDSVASVKGDAKSAADDVKGEAQSKAHDVKSDN